MNKDEGAYSEFDTSAPGEKHSDVDYGFDPFHDLRSDDEANTSQTPDEGQAGATRDELGQGDSTHQNGHASNINLQQVGSYNVQTNTGNVYSGTHNHGVHNHHHFVSNEYHNSTSNAQAEFTTWSLRSASQERDNEPPAAVDELARRLINNRLLILANAELVEKKELAQQIAWRLASMRRQHEGHEQELTVKERTETNKPLILPSFLRAERSPTLFVVPGLHRGQLGDITIESLHRELETHDHYLIATTDNEAEDWRLTQHQQVFWAYLDAAKVYEPPYLIRYLCRTLEGIDVEGLFPKGRPGPEQQNEAARLPLVAGLTLLETASTLGLPERIRTFAKLLPLQRVPLGASALRAEIRRLRGDKESIRGWFLQLDRRAQSLAASVALLDGLMDDQLFAALEVVLPKAWRSADPALQGYDYDDLLQLGGRIRQEQLANGGQIVTCYSRPQRQALLEVTWEARRRLVLGTVPVLLYLALRAARWPNRVVRPSDSRSDSMLPKSSSLNGESDAPERAVSSSNESALELPQQEVYISRWHDYNPDRELFSTLPRKATVLKTLTDSLSMLGTLSLNSVERALNRLAAHPVWETRQIAASAMARWKEHRAHWGMLYRTLQAWQKEARDKAGSGKKERAAYFARIRATVMEIVAYAAVYDQSNCLDTPLFTLTERALADDEPIVQSALKGLTVPTLVAFHRRQLDEFVISLIVRDDMLPPVAAGWAWCLELRPEEGKELVDRWHRRFREATAHPDDAPGPNERCLATLAATYGLILEDRADALPPAEVLRRLRQLLSNPHPYVRGWVLRALARRLSIHLRLHPDKVQELVQDLRLSEKPRLSAALRQLYLEQRADLRGGDRLVRLKGISYWIWARKGHRPLCQVEDVVYSWIEDPSVSEAQELALATLAEIRNTPLDVEERQLQGQALPESAPEPEPSPPKAVPTEPPHRRFLDAVQRFLLNLATWSEDFLRKPLSGLAPELLEQGRRQSGRPHQLLKDLNERGGKLANYSRSLKRFYWLYHARRALLIIGLLLAALAALIVIM